MNNHALNLEEEEDFQTYLERKLIEDNEKEMEMRYWEYVEQMALMQK
jgi:hypothetical protein